MTDDNINEDAAVLMTMFDDAEDARQAYERSKEKPKDRFFYDSTDTYLKEVTLIGKVLVFIAVVTLVVLFLVTSYLGWLLVKFL